MLNFAKWVAVALAAIIIIPLFFSSTENGGAGQKHQDVSIISMSWRAPSDSLVLKIDAAVFNPGPYAVKDVVIACNIFGQSGTKIDSSSVIVYQRFPPGQATHITQLNMGIKPPQLNTVACAVSGYSM